MLLHSIEETKQLLEQLDEQVKEIVEKRNLLKKIAGDDQKDTENKHSSKRGFLFTLNV